MIRTYMYHACRNPHCTLHKKEVVGTVPGFCPLCGWVRVLAAIRTRMVRDGLREVGGGGD